MNYITQYEIRQRYQLKALCTNVSCHVCYTLWESEERSAFASGINWTVKKEIKDKPFDKFVEEDEADSFLIKLPLPSSYLYQKYKFKLFHFFMFYLQSIWNVKQ